MPIKVVWDYTYYWGVLCQLMFQHRLTDIKLLGELRPELEAAQELNARMQAFFLQWHATNADTHSNSAVFLDQGTLDWFHELNSTLHDPLGEAQLRARLRENILQLRALAHEIVQRAAASGMAIDAAAQVEFAPEPGMVLPPGKQPTLFAQVA